jgi:hypothetical protein
LNYTIYAILTPVKPHGGGIRSITKSVIDIRKLTKAAGTADVEVVPGFVELEVAVPA